MFKFLIYLLLFYIIARLVFGRVIGTGSGFTRIYRFDTHTHHHYHKTEEKKDEGRITVNSRLNKESKGGNSDQLGEYVDYEEVK